MATLHVRQASARDAANACDVVRRSIIELCEEDHHNDPQFLTSWLSNKTPEGAAAWIANPNALVYVAEYDDRIAGIAAMNRDGMITLLYVSPDMRFRGVSKALLMQLERKAAELGLSECRLESTKTAFNFYSAAGYREQPSRSASSCGPAAENCLSMAKQIAR